MSTSSAPRGFEFGVKSKVYFGRDGKGGGGVSLPSFNVEMPGLTFPFATKTPQAEETGAKQQQFPFQMPPQVMKMLMAFMKPAIESGVAQQVLGGVI